MMLDDKIEEILARAKNVDDINHSSTTSPITNANNLNINVQAPSNALLYCCVCVCICLTVLALVFFSRSL